MVLRSTAALVLLLLAAVCLVGVESASCTTTGMVVQPENCCIGRPPPLNCCVLLGSRTCYCKPDTPVSRTCSYVLSDESKRCCGRYTAFVSYYVKTPLEQNDICGRMMALAGKLQNACYCQSTYTSCVNATTTTTKTTPTTTTTTKKTTPTTTTKKTTPTTTTKKTTPTTTTKKTTTTTPTPPVCPKPPSTTTKRMLGGSAVTTCSSMAFKLFDKIVCNGVLGYNAKAKSTVIYLSEFCRGFMEKMTTAKLTITGYNPSTFTLPNLSSPTKIGDKIVTVAPTTSSSCKTPACVYDAATMAGKVDTSKCSVISMGYHSATGSTTPTTKQLPASKITCATAPPTGTECFAATDTSAKICPEDSGAPVYCPLTTTKETVLYGLLNNLDPSGKCSSDNKFFVLPLP